MLNKNNAAIYIRVSTTEQAEEGYSVQSQIDKLTAYCMAMDYTIYDTYIDPGYTGSNINRPAMQQLIADVKKGHIDIVIVMKLDRLSRSQKDTLYLIEDVFITNDCDFVSVTESFDTTSPMGRAMIGILAVFAQFERERIKERMMDGKIERAKSGKAMAWGHVPIGYDFVDGNYIVNEYEAALVRRCFDLLESGKSINKIKRIIDEEFPAGTKYQCKDGVVHIATIKKMLRNNVYIGVSKFAKKEFEGNHEPIISKEQYDKAQIILKTNSVNALGSRKNPFKSTHLLTGFLYCGNCGARLHAQSRKHINNERWYYICYSVSKSTAKYQIDPNCKLKVIDGEATDNYIIDKIRTLKTNKEYFDEVTKNIKHDTNFENSIESKIKSIDSKLGKLMDLYLDGNFDKIMLEQKNAKLVEEKSLLEKQLYNIRKNHKVLTKREIRKKANVFIDEYDSLTLDEKKNILSSIIDRIVVSENSIEIFWNF